MRGSMYCESHSYRNNSQSKGGNRATSLLLLWFIINLNSTNLLILMMHLISHSATDSYFGYIYIEHLGMDLCCSWPQISEDNWWCCLLHYLTNLYLILKYLILKYLIILQSLCFSAPPMQNFPFLLIDIWAITCPESIELKYTGFGSHRFSHSVTFD